MSNAQQMDDAEAAFWLFFDVAQEARLTASECAKVAGISRAAWYAWTTKASKPYARRIDRMRHATKLLRADMAEKILPARTGAHRRAQVAKIVAGLEKREKEEEQ